MKLSVKSQYSKLIKEESISSNTKITYRNAYKKIGLPYGSQVEEKDVILFILKMHQEGKKASTISTYINAFGVMTEDVRNTLKAIKVKQGEFKKKADVFKQEDIDAFIDDEKIPLVCRAFIGLQFYGALRFSECKAIQPQHIQGNVLFIPKSKTDQTKKGVKILLPFKIVKVYEKLISNNESFDNLYQMKVNRWYKKYFGNSYSSHSARRSFITVAAVDKGCTNEEIMSHTRHKSHAMVNEYIDDYRKMENSAIHKFI